MTAQQTVSAQLDSTLVAARVPLDQIPLVDFGPFLQGGPAERKAVARQIGEACRNIGFFYLINHGVPPALTRQTFAEARRFFALPVEKKREIAIEKSPCHRGYFGLGGENLDPKKQLYAGDLEGGHQDRARSVARSPSGRGGPTGRCTGLINGRATCRAGTRRCRTITTRWSISAAR